MGALASVHEATPACADADMDRFALDVTRLNVTTREALTATAFEFCGRCPAIRSCGDAADDLFAAGLWAGSVRKRRHGSYGPYLVDPLIPSAPPSRHTQTGEANAA